MTFVARSVTVLTANAVTAASYYLLSVLIARRYGVVAFGGFTLASAVASLASTIPNFGIDRVLVTDLTRHRETGRETLLAALLSRGVLWLVGVPVLAGLAYVAGLQRDFGSFALLMFVAQGVLLLGESARAALYARDAIAVDASARIVARAFLALLLLLTAAIAPVAHWLVVAFVVGVGVETSGLLALAWVRTPDEGRSRGRLTRVGGGLLRRALPLAVNTVMVVAYFRAALVALGYYRGPEAVGLFGAAFSAVQVLQLISAAAVMVAMPSLVRLWSHPATFTDYLGELSEYLLLLVVPACVILSVFASEVLVPVFGARFLDAGPVLRTLVWMAVPMFLGSLWSHALIAMDRSHWVFRSAAVALPASLIACWLLVPRLGIQGAAIASILTEVAATVVTWWGLMRAGAAPRVSWRGVSILAVFLGLVVGGRAVGAAMPLTLGVALVALATAVHVAGYTTHVRLSGLTPALGAHRDSEP